MFEELACRHNDDKGHLKGCSGFIVCCAELLQALSKLIDSGLSGAEDHAEEAFLEEALRRESQAVLLLQKLLAKVDIVFDAFKLVEVNSYHHVHGGTASDRSYTSDGAEAGESALRRG